MIELSVGEGAALPTEFRIFRAGINDTSQGPIVFDADAAKSVMAAFAAHGVDMMIDLAHDSVDEAARANRSDADDARGWCSLEVRDGELWAVGVSWTPDGARRLTERTQRYVSPVVFIDEETNRAIKLFNIALCSMPATHNAAPLVAARRKLERTRRLSESGASANVMIEKVNAALRNKYSPGDGGPWVYACDVYDTWVAYELDGELWRESFVDTTDGVTLGGDAVRVERTYKPVAASYSREKYMSKKLLKALAVVAVKAARAGDEAALVALEMTPEQAKKAIAAVKDQSGDAALALVEELLASALGADSAPADAPADGNAPAEPLEGAPADPTKDETAAMGQALRRVAKLAGLPEVASTADIEAEVKRLRSEVDAVLADKAKADSDERIRLVGELVKLGSEVPATAWEEADKGIAVKRLREEPLESLRSRVAVLRKSRPALDVAAPDAALVELTEDQRARAEKMKPAQRVRFIELLSQRGKN